MQIAVSSFATEMHTGAFSVTYANDANKGKKKNTQIPSIFRVMSTRTRPTRRETRRRLCGHTGRFMCRRDTVAGERAALVFA